MTGRDNGLTALAYIVLADVEPGLADLLLEVFRSEGIAAYAAPAAPTGARPDDTTDTDTDTDDTTDTAIDLRRRRDPVDRIFVDSTASQRARVLLDERLSTEGRTDQPSTEPCGAEPCSAGQQDGEDPGEVGRPDATTAEDHPGKAPRRGDAPTPFDEDAAWDAIVAGWDLTAPGPATRRGSGARALPGEERRTDEHGPDERGPDGGPARTSPPDEQPHPRRLRRLRRRSDQSGSEPVGRGPDRRTDAEREGYVPPPPPPVPRGDLVTRLAWAGLIGSPVVFLVVTLLDLGPLPRGLLALVLAAFVGGFVTLVARMQDRPPGSGPDDGAVV